VPVSDLALASALSGSVGVGGQSRYTAGAVKGPFYEDDYDDGEGEGDGEDGSTDTDGSSVHTPTESSLPLSTPFPNTNINTTTSKPPLTSLPPLPPTPTRTNPHLKTLQSTNHPNPSAQSAPRASYSPVVPLSGGRRGRIWVCWRLRVGGERGGMGSIFSAGGGGWGWGEWGFGRTWGTVSE